MEPKQPAPLKAAPPAGSDPASSRGPARRAHAAGLDALPDNAPADVLARSILNTYPDLFKALAKA